MPKPPDPAETEAATLERALADVLRELLTEPMTITSLANWFSTNRRKMREIIDATPDVERVAGMFRFPLLKMPPKYLVARGIIRSNLRACGNRDK